MFINPLTAIGMVERCKELGARSVIVTAAASQIGRMLIYLLIQNGITPICTVRKENQAQMLKAALGPRFEKFVINTSAPDFKKTMGAVCIRLKPKVCLECISGGMTGLMMDFLTFESTVILYGLLSDQPAGNINTLMFIAKNQTLESFLLNNWLAKKTLAQYFEIVL